MGSSQNWQERGNPSMSISRNNIRKWKTLTIQLIRKEELKRRKIKTIRKLNLKAKAKGKKKKGYLKEK